MKIKLLGLIPFIGLGLLTPNVNALELTEAQLKHQYKARVLRIVGKLRDDSPENSTRRSLIDTAYQSILNGEHDRLIWDSGNSYCFEKLSKGTNLKSHVTRRTKYISDLVNKGGDRDGLSFRIYIMGISAAKVADEHFCPD